MGLRPLPYGAAAPYPAYIYSILKLWTVIIEEVTTMGYKFDSHRYITRGVAAEIPLDIQLMLFESIEAGRAPGGRRAEKETVLRESFRRGR